MSNRWFMGKTVEINVTGKVQGVYFRKYTKEKANALGLVGWVQNQADGSVHILAYGSEQDLDELIAFCHLGSPQADVKAVEVRAAENHAAGEYFNIRPTP